MLLTNHALPRHDIQTESVRFHLGDVPGRCSAYIKRIDDTHANAKRLWVKAGEPEYPGASEVARLQEASRLLQESQPCEVVDGILLLDIVLPPQAVAAITIEWLQA